MAIKMTKWCGGFLLLMLLFDACSTSSGGEESKCRYGKTAPIFQFSSPEIQSHAFEQKGQGGLEEVHFQDGTILSLEQTGCNEIRQEFRVQIPLISCETLDNECVLNLSLSVLRFWASLREELAQFAAIANVMELKKEQFAKDRTMELEEGFYATVSSFREAAGGQLILIFEN